MKYKYVTIPFTIALFISFIISSCERYAPGDNGYVNTIILPTVATSQVNAVTSTTAVGGGNVTASGGGGVAERGVCWSTTPTPTIAGPHKASGINTGSFTCSITGLLPNTTYYLRAYALNAAGTSYGIEIQFTTAAAGTVTTPDVYVAGTDNTGSSVAKLWKNGVSVPLQGATLALTGATDLRFSGTDMYIVGGDNLGSNPLVWKNTNLMTLPTDPCGILQADAFFVSGPDIYYAGEAFQSGCGTVKLAIWKNGTLSILSTNGIPGNFGVNSMFVSGTDVYAVGYDHDPTIQSAMFWKNGIASNLASNQAEANDVYVSGSDVYVAGWEENASGTTIAKVWKNGIATLLSNGTSDMAAKKMIVIGTDVYVVGGEYVGLNQRIVIWKNGVLSNLTNGINNAYATSISVFGSDVYVCGNEQIGGTWIAKVWKNGVATTLATNAFANAIIVK
jgi:hypothetical protein